MIYNDPIITTAVVFARNCEVRKIDRKTAGRFLDSNHLFGNAACRHCYGLFRKRVTGSSELKSEQMGELLAVACFSNARRWQKGERTISSYEWVRYASLVDIRVVGGMGKLLKAFIEDRHPDDIMTYAISSAGPGRAVREDMPGFMPGEVYRKLGFTEEERKSFPVRDGLPGATALSIKYRLKLTDWQ